MLVPSPAMSAGLLVTVLPLLDSLDLPRPTVREALAALGVCNAQAYDRRERLRRVLPDLEPRNGRRPRPRPTVAQTNHLTREVLDFLLEHPGAARRAGGHTRYTTAWRHFAIELVESHHEHSHAALAEALALPLSTLERWLATGETREGREPEALGDEEPIAGFEALLEAWDHWRGDFTGFCVHVRQDLGLPWGPKLVGDILYAEGRRKRRHRKRTGEATRGQYRTHFPGAQWGADGTKITVTVGEEDYTFNLELVADVDSAALVGGELSAAEDGEALLSALDDARRTTGERPLALVLDNHRPNHSPRVVRGLDSTLKIRTTVRRPQNNAHVEGSFGLFKRALPELEVPSLEPEAVARSMARAVARTWARTLNHRPRAGRRGWSRAQLYRGAEPTEAELRAARLDLRERALNQERRYRRQAAGLDPVLRAHLHAAMDELDLPDLHGRFFKALARYPGDAVLSGLAIFRGKLAAGTLPEGADTRYLLGIVHNVAGEDEGWAIARALLRERRLAWDRIFVHLRQERARLEVQDLDLEALLRAFVDQALASRRQLDRAWWLEAVAEHVRLVDPRHHSDLYELAARRIWTQHRVDTRERQRLTRWLAGLIFPTD